MTKIFYAFLILLVLFIVSIVSAVNSSIVIDKIAKEFAPDYNLSYDHISGNVFTGIKIDKLKYDNQTIAKDIIYRWDPVSLLQKKISIDQIKIEDADIDVIKSLITSFGVDASDDNSTNGFSFDVGIDNISISLNPFTENGIAFHKTILTSKDITYFSSGKVEVKSLALDVDSNLTKFSFKGEMKENKLYVERLSIESLDTEMLEMIIARFRTTQEPKRADDTNSTDSLSNPLIPNTIIVKHFEGSLQARDYMGIDFDLFDIKVDDLEMDIQKIVQNKKNGLAIGNFELQMESNVTDITLQANITDEKAVFDHLILKEVDSLALQKLFIEEKRESNTTEEQINSKKNETNRLIPDMIEIKKMYTQILPREYTPVQIDNLELEVEAIVLDVANHLVKKGKLDLNATSNMATLVYSGDINENQLNGKVHLLPLKYLYERYALPLRQDAIPDIEVDLNVSKEHIVAVVNTEAKNLLKAKEGAFNLDMKHLHSQIVYDLHTNQLDVDSDAQLTLPFAKNIALSNVFSMVNEKIHYTGELKAVSLEGFDQKFTKLLDNLHIVYSGDQESLQADIVTKQLKGEFYSKDMKKGDFHLETKKPVLLDQYISLPETFNKTKFYATVDTPIDFNQPTPLDAKISVISNILNIDADVTYEKNVQIQAKILLPKDSLLKDINEDVKWDAVTPMNVNVNLGEEEITLNLASEALKTDIKYGLKSDKINGQIKLGGMVANVDGITKKSIKISSKITSMKSLKKSIASLYTMKELPPVEGGANISATLTGLKKLNLTLTSPKLTYKADRKSKHILNNVNLKVSLESSKIVIDTYSLTYNKQKYYATKPSQLSINDDQLRVDSLWLNDALNVNGVYNLKTQQGRFDTKATKLPLRHEYVDLESVVDLKTVVDGNSTSVNGKITLLGGHIKYDIAQKTFASDSDIIIVQEMRKKKASPFMANLSTNIQIETKKPLILRQGAINIRLKPELGINKAAHSPLLVLGSVEILKGGSYTFEGKKFILEKSFIHFTGDINKPLLEIKVKHRAVNHLITINISGTPDAPEIAFSSSPSLTKEQILSVILFDTEAGGDTHSGDEMMKMMGGAMAKSALNDLGIKLDHLVLGEGNSIEVGKKLTNKMTVIYINGTVPKVKLKYRHGEHTESIIGVSEESQSYDIIYKGDF